MEETILLIIFAAGLGNYLDEQKPLDLLYELENGQIVETSVYKNNDYFCPVYCESSHKHIGHFSNLDCGMGDECYHFNHPKFLANKNMKEEKKEIWAHDYYNKIVLFTFITKLTGIKVNGRPS